MAVTDVRVRLDPAAIDELLNTPAGPVGIEIDELSAKATDLARAGAPVMTRRYNPVHEAVWYYGPPGHMKESVHKTGFRFNKLMQMYNGVNVNFGPTLYLQYPARQYNGSERYMFMSHALDALAY